ncbi:MAG: hypothetical protein Q7U55_06670 [Deltaproteobacteria bacterium]|nr:hypothetical protein [Deltaproteobacteria bacterium]
MNEENKRENIREEIDRANEAIRASNLLFENGFVIDFYRYAPYALRFASFYYPLAPNAFRLTESKEK